MKFLSIIRTTLLPALLACATIQAMDQDGDHQMGLGGQAQSKQERAEESSAAPLDMERVVSLFKKAYGDIPKAFIKLLEPSKEDLQEGDNLSKENVERWIQAISNPEFDVFLKKKFIFNGSNINAIMYAMSKDLHPTKIEFLIEAYSNNINDDYFITQVLENDETIQSTALLYAITLRNPAYVSLLLYRGADPNLPQQLHYEDNIRPALRPLALTMQFPPNKNDALIRELLLIYGALIGSNPTPETSTLTAIKNAENKKQAIGQIYGPPITKNGGLLQAINQDNPDACAWLLEQYPDIIDHPDDSDHHLLLTYQNIKTPLNSKYQDRERQGALCRSQEVMHLLLMHGAATKAACAHIPEPSKFMQQLNQDPAATGIMRKYLPGTPRKSFKQPLNKLIAKRETGSLFGRKTKLAALSITTKTMKYDPDHVIEKV